MSEQPDYKTDPEYARAQADSLLKQWQFYQELTWRIPTMAVYVNAGFYALVKLFDENIISIPRGHIVCTLCVLIGSWTFLYGHRLYRSSKLAQRIMDELHDKLDHKYGIQGIIRSTRDIKDWPIWENYSSRNAMSYGLELWGIILVCIGMFGVFVGM